MNPESRITIHMGINFVLSPMFVVDRDRNISFQQALASQGIDFQKIDSKNGGLVIIRERPSRLEIRVATLGLPGGQLLVVAPHPERHLTLFEQEAEAAVAAFESTWPQKQRQVVRCDATLRDLYQTTSDHAFRELWEGRLRQSPESLAPLGRPVLGGGLRLVMPPRLHDPEQVQIEVKVESYLTDTKRLFVETQFTWLAPKAPGEALDPTSRLEQVDSYVKNEVISFIMGGSE